MQHPSLARFGVERTWNWVLGTAEGHLQKGNAVHKPEYIGRLFFSHNWSTFDSSPCSKHWSAVLLLKKEVQHVFCEVFMCFLQAPGAARNLPAARSAKVLYKSRFIATKVFFEELHVTCILCWCSMLVVSVCRDMCQVKT